MATILVPFIHAFIDLRCINSATRRITIPSNGQNCIQPGLYAVVHSFDILNQKEEELIMSSNTLIGRFVPHFHSLAQTKPTLYLADVDAIRSPIVGIKDVTAIGRSVPSRERVHLFLVRRKAMWPAAWDSVINAPYAGTDQPEDEENPLFESEYESIVKSPSGGTKFEQKSIEELTAASEAARIAKRKKDGKKQETNDNVIKKQKRK